MNPPVSEGDRTRRQIRVPSSERRAGGETPADTAGIRVAGENKWITIVQNAKLGESHA